MPVPPAPPPLAQLGTRRFSFYPAILNIQHNEWIYRRATWSEALVQNAKTHDEVWMPRQYLGDISRVDAPVMIVGLLKELEYQEGAIRPMVRRVIEMPRAVNESPRAWTAPARPAPVVGIRLEDGRFARAGKTGLAGVALGLAGCVLAINLYRGGLNASRVFYAPLPADVPLTAADGHADVVRTLGEPAAERWRANSGMEYQVLEYPRRGLYVILAGRDRRAVHYAGALDRNWRPVHTVELSGGGDGYALLHNLDKIR